MGLVLVRASQLREPQGPRLQAWPMSSEGRLSTEFLHRDTIYQDSTCLRCAFN
jgi:hypothetical protein